MLTNFKFTVNCYMWGQTTQILPINVFLGILARAK